MQPERAATVLAWLLILLGVLAATAVVPMLMPFSWMQAANDWLGLEPLERTPLAEYLTRSLSALYCFFGVLTIYLGRNVSRYSELIGVIGWLTAFLGLALTGIDRAAELPAAWFWSEGPPTVAVGLVIVWLARRVSSG